MDNRPIENVVLEHMEISQALPLAMRGAILAALSELKRDRRALATWQDEYAKQQEAYLAAQAEIHTLTARCQELQAQVDGRAMEPPRHPAPIPTHRTEFADAIGEIFAVLAHGEQIHGDDWKRRLDAIDAEHAAAHLMRGSTRPTQRDADSGLPDLAHAAARIILMLQRRHNAFMAAQRKQ